MPNETEKIKLETANLFSQLRAGCAQARDRIVALNYGLIVEFLERTWPGEWPASGADDLEQELAIALLEAVDSFDSDREICFSTWANQQFRTALRAWRRSSRRRGRDGKVVRQFNMAASLHSPEGVVVDGARLEEKLSVFDERTGRFEEFLTAILGPAEGDIKKSFRLRFENGLSMDVIGEILGVSRATVRGWHSTVIRAAREKFTPKELAEFLTE